MIGAIAGDIVGSVYESRPIKTKDFPLFHSESVFTDDTVLTVAVAEAILTGRPYENSIREIGRRHPYAGYGGSFFHWLHSDAPHPYNSWGNGSAMRVSPVGFAFDREEEVLREAARSAEITHNHPEGIKGAQATALAILLARTFRDRDRIRDEISGRFGYDLTRTVDDIRPTYSFDVSCQGTVPEAIIAFLGSTSFEDALRNAVSLGGDSDTLACITGGIAEAFYGEVPAEIITQVKQRLSPDLREITARFREHYCASHEHNDLPQTP
ncbi:MAG TPA: ADP-ribosylglycohydrolase family protein [Deltaproteobacteria bacterium]|nr:ADP-ribosylglycohydrolase family protein [Deltaproteobacteria bacterium]